MRDYEKILAEQLKTEGLTPHVVRELRQWYGWSYERIGTGAGKTKQAAWWVDNHYNPPTLRQMANEKWPFDTKNVHADAYIHTMLRKHLETMIDSGDGITPPEDLDPELAVRLKAWYRKLLTDNVVVEFDPDLPTSPDAVKGGWAYRPRLRRDDNLIIRVNKHTRKIEQEDKWLWKIPSWGY